MIGMQYCQDMNELNELADSDNEHLVLVIRIRLVESQVRRHL